MKELCMKRIFAFFACLVMLISATALTVGAAEEDEEYVPVEWTMDENVEYLYGGEKRYDRYYVRGAFCGDAKKAFYFMNRAAYDGRECQVYGESAYPHIVSVNNGDGYSYVFTDEEGRKILDDFLSGEECIYYLEEFDVQYSVIGKEFVKTLDDTYRDKGTRLTDVAVNELAEGEIYEVTVHDRYEMKAYQRGAVYVMPDGTYYYVCFEDLDNSYFDADGYFSYRSGTVKALKLISTLRKQVDTAIEAMQPKEKTVVYEHNVVMGIVDLDGNRIDDDPYDLGESTERAVAAFWICFTLLGFILPTPLLAVGLTLPHSKKSCGSNTWYLLAGCAAVWIVAAAVLLLVFLL